MSKKRPRLSKDKKKSKRIRLLRELDDGIGDYMEPQDERYQELLDCSYSKLQVIPSHHTPPCLHSKVQSSLSQLLEAGYFTHNLVTKEAKTLLTPVTRFVAGKRGLTYPYLGLRLFAFPWEVDDGLKSDVEKSLCVLGELNDYMKVNGDKMWSEGEVNRFNMTLVNYMDPGHVTVPLAAEPYYHMGMCAVHWHSDQNVQDNCSIGVYSHTVGEMDQSVPWSIGLKIAWDVVTSAVKIPVPDGSCYFLLHDMNMTHQHTVIVGDEPRFSSTHRVVLLEGNTLEYISERCRQAEATADRLNVEGVLCGRDNELEVCLEIQREVEFQWIRQFWCLGASNAKRHAGFWLGHVEGMEQTWENIEQAIKILYDRLLEVTHTAKSEHENVPSQSDRSTKILLQHLETREKNRQDWKRRYTSSVLRYLSDSDLPVERPAFPRDHPHFPYIQSEAIQTLRSQLGAK